MAVKISYLISEITIALLQLAVIICNGFILFLFNKEKNVYHNYSRLLVLFLVATDFLHAVTTLPYSIYLLISWNFVHVDLNPYYVRITSVPFIVQLKINLTLTISIAAERILVLYFPVAFRKLSCCSYPKFCLLFGFLLGVIDLIVEFSISPFIRAPDFVAIGCFLTNQFRYYWGMSNMIMGIVVILLSILILVKLRTMQHKTEPLEVTNSRANKFKQANRNCVGILLTSLLFVTLPSVGVGISAVTSFRICKTVGPYYIVFLLCAGVCNGVVHVVLNKNMRTLGANCFNAKRRVLVHFASPARAASTKFLTHHIPGSQAVLF
ncbi:hypothetical protein Angca_000353 [Angiostrongylus cantonensis]|nr:hypothetical protein Angca_000353 [Angiostrongylus cantonensis]